MKKIILLLLISTLFSFNGQCQTAAQYLTKGDIKYKAGDLKSAIVLFDKAIKLNPNLTEAYQKRGLAKSDLGNDKAAIIDYNRAIKLNPKKPYRI